MDVLYVVLAVIVVALLVQAVAAHRGGLGGPSMDRHRDAMTRLGAMSGQMKLLGERQVSAHGSAPTVHDARPAHGAPGRFSPPAPPRADGADGGAGAVTVEVASTSPTPERARERTASGNGAATTRSADGVGGGRRRPVPLWAGAVAAVVLGGTAAGLLLSAPSRRAVPDLVGLPAPQAEQNATAAGFTWRLVHIPSPDAPAAGRVLAQVPAAPATLAVGSRLTLRIGAPVTRAAVPDVEHRNAAAAEAAVRAAGFDARLRPVEDGSLRELALQGDVLRQIPAPGRSEEQHSVVTLEVVAGTAPVTVPSALVGEPLAQAGATLAGAQLRVGSATRALSATIPAGQVTRSSPRPGQRVAVGTTVDLVVSAGPPAVVPQLRGDSLAEARHALRAARLALGTVTYAPGANGVVLAQATQARTTAPPGTAITLVVGRPAVPQLRGDTLAGARHALAAAGLALGTVTYAPGANGVVLAQQAQAGTLLPQASSVDLVVGKGRATPPPRAVGGR